MLTGIRFKAYPSGEQAKTLSHWIGCARVVWNAKCDEDEYLRTFAKKYLPIGTFPELNKEYAHFKGEDTAWLKSCPSQLMRNSATLWHRTYVNFLKGICGRPVRKKSAKGNYIWLTRELFQIEQIDGRWLLKIGSKTNTIGVLPVRWHKKPKRLPNSIWIRVEHGRWTVSFSYENGQNEQQLSSLSDHFEWLRGATRAQLEAMITSLDRGVERTVQTPDRFFKPTEKAQNKARKRERHIKRFQTKLTRQKKGSNKQKSTKRRIGKLHRKTRYVREDFLHKTSRTLVDDSAVIVMEDLKMKNMTRRSKAKQCPHTGKWLRNNAAAKSGLNKSLLGAGLYKLELFIGYKMYAANKPIFKVSAYNTSRECAVCSHTHEANRPSQATFHCQSCGHTDNADRNAACVIKKRAIDLIQHSGTELSERGVLRPSQALGQALNGSKTVTGKPVTAGRARSKKKVSAAQVAA